MAPEGTARGGARGGRPRGTRPRRGRGGRGGSTAAAASGNATPDFADVQMNDAPVAAAAEASSSATGANTPDHPTPNATPQPTAARPTPARGSGGAKFLPRAVRRSQVDREAIAAQESAKQDDKAALDARLKRGGRGGRGGGGRRARGGPPGGFDRVIRGGSGGFGSGIQSSTVRGSSSNFGRLFDFGSAGGGSSGASGARGGVKSEGGPSDFTESSRPTGRRMNTDKIVDFEYITIEDDEETKTKDNAPVLLPKGMMREDPKESDQPDIITKAELEAAERGEPTVISSSTSDDDDVFYNENDTEMKDDGRKWPGAKEARSIKIEGEDITEIDTLTQRRALKKEEQKAEKKKAKYQDLEEEMQAEKLASQRLLFGVQSDEDSDIEGEGVKEPRKPQIMDGGLYLWQFPPVMPPLHKANKPKNYSLVKDEPKDDDIVMTNVPVHDSRDKKPVDLTSDETGEGSAKMQQSENEEEPEGFVGKLIVRKSGKMQMDWGGMLFDVSTGIPVNFFRQAVLTEEDDEKKPDGYHGTAYGMGQIMGKFNAVPHFSEEETWHVPPSELPPWGVTAAPDGDEMAD